jgi:hypothetical protein
MKLFGGRSSGGRRSAGARPMKAARPVVMSRSPEAALGRETRGLLSPARRSAPPPSSSGRGGGLGRSARSATGRRWFGGGFGGRLLAPVRAIGRIATPARAAALLGLLASGFLLNFVTGRTAFGLTRTDVPALTWTDPAAVVAALGLTQGRNVFQLDTAPLEAALRTLPAVANAEVTVQLPDAVVVVAIEERVPILAWQVGDTRYLADREGTIFATAPDGDPLPTGVAVIEDRRVGADATLAVGTTLDVVDLDVATRLGSLTPDDVGSAVTRLKVAVTDDDGFIVNAPGSWTAVFGFYSPSTRATDMIPGQVRLLRSLLAGGEGTLTRIILASESGGTYVPKPTRKP